LLRHRRAGAGQGRRAARLAAPVAAGRGLSAGAPPRRRQGRVERGPAPVARQRRRPDQRRHRPYRRGGRAVRRDPAAP
ncbi:hypothetical protein LTR94_038062, partial [Friedmanniomyces endolithicus]